MNINQRIFNEIKQKNLKEAELAKKLQVRSSVISSWKTRGTTPPAEYIVRICEFIGVSVSELLEIETDLTEQESKLLEYFRKMDPEDKTMILGEARYAALKAKKIEESLIS